MLFAVTLIWANISAAAHFDIDLYLVNRGTVRGGARDTTLVLRTLELDLPGGVQEIPYFDTSLYLAPSPREIYYSGFAEAAVRGEFWDWLTVGLMLNSGEVRERTLSRETRERTWTMNGRRVLDELRNSGLVREAYLSFYAPKTRWIQVDVGRRLWRVGNSLIYDDWGLGARVNMDFELLRGAPWRLDLSYIIPSRDWLRPPVRSPLVTARVDYALSLFETLSLAVSYFHDGDNALSEIIREHVIERRDVALERLRQSSWPPETRDELASLVEAQLALGNILQRPLSVEANLFYATLSGNKTLGPGTLRGTLVLEAGRVFARDNLAAPLLNFDQLGLAFDVAYRWSVTGRFALSPFVFAQSGHAGSEREDATRRFYGAFVGVLPFITRTSLFFAGGLSETFGARTATSAGVNGRGVVAPGLEAVYEPVDPLRLRAVLAPLFSWAPSVPIPVGGGGRFYGLEIDTIIYYQPWRFLGFQLEADGWFFSTFFRSQAPVWKVVLSTDLSGVWRL